MNLPTEHQWAQYSALCARLQPLPTAARAADLQGLRTAGAEDPQVLALVAVHFALPPDPDRLPRGARVGSCTVEEPLGAGGMGVVYRAQQHLGPAQRPVAVKLIHPALLRTARAEACTQFLGELHTLVTLQHDSIARIYDGGLYDDSRTHEPLPYLVMELVRDGLALTTYARDYALAWPERLALGLRVCRAVQYAHEHRVVHRDLKPANILVDPEGHPMVIDFGLACAADALLPGAHLAAAGTPAYMSPEQVSDAFGPISAKSDVYALGLLLYELLTEQLPYAFSPDGAVEDLCQVITTTRPPPLRQHDSAYGEELDALVAAALAKRPAERPTVAVLRSRLERALQQLPPARARPRRPPARQTWEPAGALPTCPPPAAGSGAGGSGRPEAERRQLTILCCDFVDTTARAGHRDPEDGREVVRAYQQTCEKVIQRCGGSLVQALGDGLLVYFGWPQAQEDAALRAVRTGLGLLETIGSLHTQLTPAHDLRLAVRVSIHTGLAVVEARGDGSRQEPRALGDTPTIASRLLGLAPPDTLVISAATLHLVQGYCTVKDLGPQALPGVATPLQVYQVVGASAAQSRLDVAATTGLTPLVGREAEVALLRARWAQSRAGQGQVVLLSGEAGIGKSRLVEELTTHVRGEGARRLMFRCSPDHTHSAFFPVIAHLQRLMHWHQGEAPEARVTKLEQALQSYGFALEDVVPLFAALLSLPLPERYPPLMLSPQRQKQQTQEALVAWVLAEAERQPVLVVWEDLHWADPSSLEVLRVLIDQTPTAPLLTLLACRPEFDPPWSTRAPVTQLTLPRVTRPQIEVMVRHLAGGKRLPAAVVQQISVQTDGVPLFVEEVTKAVVESGLLKETAERYECTSPWPALALPTTLQDALMARLDRLGTAKGLAQLGATIGRQFPYTLLREVAQRDDATVQRELGRLVEAALLYQRGQPPLATYRFKHALIQDAAYQSLLKSTRQQYHRHIAQVMEERFPNLVETQPELLAHHYTEAGLSQQAISYWQRAGRRAAEHSAHMEAIAHLTKGLEVLKTLPDTLERTQQELVLQITLGSVWIATRGYAAPEVEQAYTRALELCRQVGETPRLLQALFGLETFYFFRGELQTARELGEQGLLQAQRLYDPARCLLAHYALGGALFHLGELIAARAHFERVITLYVPQQRRPRAVQDPGVGSRSYMAWTLWYLGYADQALERSREAVRLAQELSHPFSLAVALDLAAWLHQCCRERQAVQERAETAITLCTEQGFPYWLAWAMILRGWALTEQGQGEEGMVQIRQGLANYRATGAKLGWSYFLALLTEAYEKAGQTEEGLRVLAEALAVVHQMGEPLWEAELHRLQGALLLQQSIPNEHQAETCFQTALAIARRYQAKTLELRAATSLARWWWQQGKREAGYGLLASVYGWFTEGFDTADLQEAKMLLEEIA